MLNFVAIDFETANHSRESACSVGLVKYEAGKITDTFYSLIRPPVLNILPEFTGIHGLTADDVKEAPMFKDIWKSAVRPFIRGFPLAAHHAQFDMGVLRAVLKWYELPVPRLSYFCTCSLARYAWPGFQSYALTKMAEQFGIVYNAHHALDDAKTCGKLVQLAAKQFGSVSIETVLAAAGIKMNVLYSGSKNTRRMP